MAIYDNLPVYKACYDLLIDAYDVCSRVNREFKYTLGDKLKNDITDLMVCIYEANASHEKKSHLRNAKQLLIKVKIYIRLLHDLRQLSTRRLALLSDKAETVSKQLTAWYNSQKEKKNNNND